MMPGLLTRMLTPQRLSSHSVQSVFGSGISGMLSRTATGITVNANTAMNYSAVWAASRILTETMAALPRFLYQQQGRMKLPANGHPTYRCFKKEVNPQQSAFQFWSYTLNGIINWGNGYAEKQYDGLGRVAKLWPIHPSRIPKENIVVDPETGKTIYRVRNNEGIGTTDIPAEDMLHIPGILSDDGITGKGVIQYGAESIGMGLATEQCGASFFGNGMGPAIVMTHPKKLGEPAADNLRKSWWKRYPPGQPNKGNSFLVLEEGATIERLTIPPEQAQFLGTRQFNITEIARWYNLPVHLLREMSKSSFNNIESENLHFVIISLMPWLVRIEEECNRQLLQESEKDTYYFKFMLQGLLRGDMAARAQFYKEMFAMGTFSPNDILELEDQNPIGPEGDIRLVPLNMASLASMSKATEMTTLEEPSTVAPSQPVTETNEAEPVESSTDAAKQADIQGTALNGAQITAMVDVVGRVAGGQLPPDAARAMLRAAFPITDQTLIDTMVDAAAEMAEKAVEPRPAPPSQQDPASGERPSDEAGETDGDGQGDGRNDDDAGLAVSAMRSAARTLFVDQFARLCRKEAKGIAWAAEEPKRFLSRLDEFFARHRATFAEQLTGVLEGAAAVGVKVTSAEFCENHLSQVYEAVVELSGTATLETLAASVGEWAADHQHFAERVAVELFDIPECEGSDHACSSG